MERFHAVREIMREAEFDVAVGPVGSNVGRDHSRNLEVVL